MNYHTYSMDMAGYGNSDMLVDGFEYTLINQAEVILRVLSKS